MLQSTCYNVSNAMRRELFIHFSFWLSFFVLISLVRQFFNFSYWPFWVGGIVGLFLPDIDHLVYIFFLKPQELTSQRINFLIDRHEIKRTLTLIYETRTERRDLIFHSVLFQLIFLVLTFWIMTSSGSFFGKGLVLSFSMHLLVDQLIDLNDIKSFDNWTKNFLIKFDLRQAQIYIGALAFIVILFGIFF